MDESAIRWEASLTFVEIAWQRLQLKLGASCRHLSMSPNAMAARVTTEAVH